MASASQAIRREVYFGAFLVTSQVFYSSAHSYALVNLKPLLPGHVLVCPNRVVPRLKDLSSDEITDLFLTVQKVGRVIERVYKADALNIAIQDGVAAGQSVPHVHTHVIPRHFKDLPEDQIYQMLESRDGDLGRNFAEAHQQQRINGPMGSVGPSAGAERVKFPTVWPDEARKPRSEKIMEEEARWLAGCMRGGDDS